MSSVGTAITALAHLIRAEGTLFNTIGGFRFVSLLWFPAPQLKYQKLECRVSTQNRLESTNCACILPRFAAKHDVVIHKAFKTD